MTTIARRLDTHFAACAAAAAAAAIGGAQSAQAAIHWSGIVNITIPGNIDGVYLNVETGATGTSGSGTPGWDINPYFGANTFFAAAPNYGTVANGTNVAALAAGVMIDGSNATSTSVTSGSLFPTTGSGAYYGFRFQNGAAQIRYGWARITRGSSTTTAGTLFEYAWEDSGAGILTGAIPGPGALSLLGLAGLVGTRRRRN